jgi:lactam utilization protein B
VDINSDLGESFGAYTIARDALARAGVEIAPLSRWLS